MCKYVDMYKPLRYSKKAFALYILLCHYFFLHLTYYIWYRRMNENLYILHWIVNKIVYCIKYLHKLPTFQYFVCIIHIILGVMVWFTADLPKHISFSRYKNTLICVRSTKGPSLILRIVLIDKTAWHDPCVDRKL